MYVIKKIYLASFCFREHVLARPLRSQQNDTPVYIARSTSKEISIRQNKEVTFNVGYWCFFVLKERAFLKTHNPLKRQTDDDGVQHQASEVLTVFDCHHNEFLTTAFVPIQVHYDP